MSRTPAEIDPKSSEILGLGACRYDLKTKELQDADGNSVPLRSQSAEVLDYLARHLGEVVSKETLIESLWADTFVTDDSLVQCIGDIRRALGDSEHKIVQTFPKRGYQLNGEPLTQAPAAAVPPAPGQERPFGRFAILAVALVAVVVLGVLGWMQFGPKDSPVPKGEKPRIAVLPFDDFSTGEDKGYLSDAIAEGIITELARSTFFDVVARNSSFKFRGSDTDLRDIGADLGAHYLLEGSKQKDGDKLRVTVQLIETVNGTHVWAHTYEQPVGDLFAVQDAIIKTVADRIGYRISRPVPGSDPDRVTALHIYLDNLAKIREDFNEETVRDNVVSNLKAVEIAPDAAYGYIGLAHNHRSAAVFGWLEMDEDEALDKALGYGLKALELAPEDPEVHYALARIYSETGDRAKAIAAYDRAIQLNPSASNYLVGSTTPLLYAGETEQAIERLNQAMGIDPYHPDWYHWQMGWALWEIEDCDGALASMLRMNKIRRGAHRMLSGIYACLGEVEKAQDAYQVFYAEADEPTIAEQRAEWEDVWTAPGSLDRWLEHMRIAGMKD